MTMPFVPGILILLIISIIVARFWTNIASAIGGGIRKIFIKIYDFLKALFY